MSLRRIVGIATRTLAILALCTIAGSGSHAEAEDPHCIQVGGGVLTNSLDPTDTLGTATGDLAGGLGISVLSVTPGSGGGPTIYRVHHH
jgi:hypothetical protein